MMKCKQCGQRIENTEKRCPYCGYIIEQEIQGFSGNTIIKICGVFWFFLTMVLFASLFN